VNVCGVSGVLLSTVITSPEATLGVDGVNM
jgi:hypothetical protein